MGVQCGACGQSAPYLAMAYLIDINQNIKHFEQGYGVKEMPKKSSPIPKHNQDPDMSTKLLVRQRANDGRKVLQYS